MRLLAIAGAIAAGVLCGLGLTLRPAAAQDHRVLVLTGSCAPAAIADLELRREGFEPFARALFSEDRPWLLWRRADGDWRAILYRPDPAGDPLACLAGSGTRMARVAGEGA